MFLFGLRSDWDRIDLKSDLLGFNALNIYAVRSDIQLVI